MCVGLLKWQYSLLVIYGSILDYSLYDVKLAVTSAHRLLDTNDTFAKSKSPGQYKLFA